MKNNLGEGREAIRIVLTNASKLTRKRAFCLCCGSYLFAYYDEIKLIIEGQTEAQPRQIEIRCYTCKVEYQIC